MLYQLSYGHHLPGGPGCVSLRQRLGSPLNAVKPVHRYGGIGRVIGGLGGGLVRRVWGGLQPRANLPADAYDPGGISIQGMPVSKGVRDVLRRGYGVLRHGFGELYDS